MEIPYENLSPDVLCRLIEQFILREGTDYGVHEFTLEQKVAQVRGQLVSGKAKIVFNQDDETCDIVPTEGRQGGRGFD